MSIAQRLIAAEVVGPIAAGGGVRAFELLGPPDRTRYERLVKPVFDRMGAAVLLLLLAPVMLLAALVVFLRLGSPVLFRQERVGLGGEVFNVLKFRTMQPDRRKAAVHYVGPERRVCHKDPHDPRLDGYGRFLRATSLDELPQLFNVLRGQMSLVGPRPELVDIVERHYEPWQHVRHTVKPGLTGLWQVTARANGNGLMHEFTELDIRYVQEVTARADLAILLRTVPAVMGRQRGF